MRKEPLAIFIFAGAVLAIWAWYEFRPAGPVAPIQTEEVLARGTNRLGDITVLNRNWSVLEELTWEDLNSTAAAFGGQDLLRQRFLEETSATSHPPTIYLRGLVALANDQPAQAATEFARLAPDELPVALLYAPWRVLSGIEPQVPNAFTAPLLTAANEGKIAPLLAARVFTFEAQPEAALKAYLQTDPAEWTDLDLEAFRILLENEAVRADAGSLLLAAFRGGRLVETVRPGAARLLLAGAETPRNLGPELQEFLSTNPAAQTIAEETLISLLEDRRLFLEDKFPDFLAKHRESKPTELIDETVILLVLAAASEPQNPDFFRWSQELERRFPQPEVATWLESLKTEIP